MVDDGSTDDTARVVERIAEELEVRRSEIGKERGAGSREIIVVDDGSTDGTAEEVERIITENEGLIVEDGGDGAKRQKIEVRR